MALSIVRRRSNVLKPSLGPQICYIHTCLVWFLVVSDLSIPLENSPTARQGGMFDSSPPGVFYKHAQFKASPKMRWTTWNTIVESVLISEDFNMQVVENACSGKSLCSYCLLTDSCRYESTDDEISRLEADVKENYGVVPDYASLAPPEVVPEVSFIASEHCSIVSIYRHCFFAFCKVLTAAHFVS